METIQIDFDVYKALTARRSTQQTSYNDVLRRMLGLDGERYRPGRAQGWTSKGVFFPIGSEFRARYDGSMHRARVVDGGLDVGGRLARSPSRAATLITGTNINGWTFWECRMPGETVWRPIKALRPVDVEDDPFATFDEWASEADDQAYRTL